jgi:putative effector of murein hydrolase LrgA (UPF0299 family)
MDHDESRETAAGAAPKGARIVAVLALAVLAGDAVVSFFIWILGTGVPAPIHQGMGLFFVLLHAAVMALIFRRFGDPLSLAAAALVVPVEIGAILVLGLIA